jgi:pimeloyl-ACP methyl ester carboxylesterase
MLTRSLRDGTETFDVTLLEAREPTRVVLFAVGGGGNPERHLPLLTRLAESGCTVIAPHFERLLAPIPTEEELLLRGRRLKLALDEWVPPAQPVVGVGHSIGATMLVALAGGQVWMRPGRRLATVTDARLCKLALLTPATGFFQAPSALDAVNVPMLIWAGSADPITPPEHAEYLQRALGSRLAVELRVVEGAGHFSFMNTPPPNTTETLPDRESFLNELATEILRYATDVTCCCT